MAREPEINHEYHAKNDKLEITIHGYALKKKSAREAIMKKVMAEIEKSPARQIANAKKVAKETKTKKLRGLQKSNKLVEVGD